MHQWTLGSHIIFYLSNLKNKIFKKSVDIGFQFIIFHLQIRANKQMKDLKIYLNIFSVLSDENRLKIYSLLINNPGGLYVCELTSLLNLPYYTISKCLKELEKVQLVEAKRIGKYILYKVPNINNENTNKQNDNQQNAGQQKDSIYLEFQTIVKKISNEFDLIDFEKLNKVLNERNSIPFLCNKLCKKTKN